MTGYVDPRDPDYYKTIEVADLFGSSRAVVLKMASEDRIPHRKTVTGVYRFPKGEIDRILREGLPAADKRTNVPHYKGSRIEAFNVPADGQWHTLDVMGEILHAEISGSNTITVHGWKLLESIKAAHEARGSWRDNDFRVLTTGEHTDRPSVHCLSLKGPVDGHIYHLVKAK